MGRFERLRHKRFGCSPRTDKWRRTGLLQPEGLGAKACREAVVTWYGTSWFAWSERDPLFLPKPEPRWCVCLVPNLYLFSSSTDAYLFPLTTCFCLQTSPRCTHAWLPAIYYYSCWLLKSGWNIIYVAVNGVYVKTEVYTWKTVPRMWFQSGFVR